VRELDPKIPLSDPRAARMCAEVFVLYGMNALRAARTLRPDLAPTSHNAFAAKMMKCPQVKREIKKLMDKPEQNADRFMQTMWEWLSDGEDSKSANERKCTAARILAKGYISEKKDKDAPVQAVKFEGLSAEGLSNLTGEVATHGESPLSVNVTDSKKVN